MTSKTATAPRRTEGRAGTVPSLPRARLASGRMIEIARAAWGAALLIGPTAMLEQIHRVRADSRSIAVARLLGARHLAQAGLSGIRPTPAVLALGVWVDAAHAGTALTLAATDHSRARAAITDAAIAVGWAAAGFRDLTQGRASHHGDRHRDQVARSVLQHLPAGRTLLSRAASRQPASRTIRLLRAQSPAPFRGRCRQGANWPDGTPHPIRRRLSLLS